MVREEYEEYCAECRWIGQRPVTFAQWLRDEYESPREAADERQAELWENDTWDLY